MTYVIPEWVLHLLGAVAAFGIAYLFFSMQLRMDFKKFTEEFSKLYALIIRFVPFLEKKMELDLYKAKTLMEERLLAFIDDNYQERRGQLIHEKSMTEFDFDRGWRLLFEEFFSGPQGILRDVTFSSHGDMSFQKYDFATYPNLVGEYINNSKYKSHEVKFMMVCSPTNSGGDNNKLAEKFLRLLLEIKYPHCPEQEELFNRWASNHQGEKPRVDIMITNDNIVKRVVGQESFDSPFNVYGNLAVSRSIVKVATEDRPLPHLEILVDPGDIERKTRLFEKVWNASIQFRERVLREMTPDQKRWNCNGQVFNLWSSHAD